jgi:chromosome segregation ATPase
MTSTPEKPESPLARARHKDVARRRLRVHHALADMRAKAEEITISGVAARAKVHRSFIHRHPDLRAEVLKAADPITTSPNSASTTTSRASLLADNANLRERNRRLTQHVRDLEDRLGEILGTQAFERSGLGAPTGTNQLEAQIDQQRQEVLDLRRVLEEREEELAGAREAHRRLMAELNRTPR